MIVSTFASSNRLLPIINGDIAISFYENKATTSPQVTFCKIDDTIQWINKSMAGDLITLPLTKDSLDELLMKNIKLILEFDYQIWVQLYGASEPRKRSHLEALISETYARIKSALLNQNELDRIFLAGAIFDGFVCKQKELVSNK